MLPKIDIVKRPPLFSLSDIIPGYISKLKVKNGYDEDSLQIIQDNWNAIVGEALAKKSSPQKVENGSLQVKVVSAIWKTELQYSKKMILQKIEKLINSKKVQNISFRS